MGGDETRRGKEAHSGGHLCHVCGYQYPNANPSAKLRRSHRKNCRKMPAAAAEEGGVLGVDEREEAAGERNAGEGLLLGGGGGEGEGNGASEANEGSALRGSAKDGDLVENKETAEHASPNGTGVQVISSECGETGLINCTNDSLEIANEDNGTITNLLLACTNGSQNKVAKHCSETAPLAVGHPAEREDSIDEYQNASPFLHQSDSEDGAAVAYNSEFSTEIKNLDSVSLQPSVAANEIPVETNVLCKDHFSREPSMTDLSADPKVGKEVECHLENRTALAEPEVSLKLESPDECSINVESNNTYMVDSKSDNTSSYCELIGEWNASSLHKCSPLISGPESQSTCSRKVEGFMEDSMDVLDIMPEGSPSPEVVGSDNVEYETVTNSSTKFMLTGNELKLIHTENATTVCTLQNWPVEDTSDVQLCVENSYQGNSVCSVVGYQNDLAVTKVDGMLNSIADDNCSEGVSVKGSELDSLCERPQTDVVEQIIDIAEENHSIEKPNGFSNEEVCNKEINPEVPTKDQGSTSQEYVAFLMDQASCTKNPFNLDDTRSDDLFELDTDSYHLESSKVVESKQQVDSKSLTVDQMTVSNQISIAEGQNCLISDDRILAVSSTRENGPAVGAEDMSVSSSFDLTKNIFFPDASVNHSMQQDIAHTNGIIFAPFQVFPVEFSTTPTSEEINALSIGVEEKMQTEGTSTKEMIAVHSMDNVEVKNQTEDTSVKEMNADFNADNVEDRREQTDDTSAEEMNAVQRTDNVEDKQQAQDTSTKETNAVQSTDSVEEKKQSEDTVGQEGNKQNEEIAATGVRSKSERIHVPLKALLAEASLEAKEKKTSTKERVLSFKRRVSKDEASSVKSGSPKAGSGDPYWNSPDRLPHNNGENRSKGRKQPWVPFICCHSVY